MGVGTVRSVWKCPSMSTILHSVAPESLRSLLSYVSYSARDGRKGILPNNTYTKKFARCDNKFSFYDTLKMKGECANVIDVAARCFLVITLKVHISWLYTALFGCRELDINVSFFIMFVSFYSILGMQTFRIIYQEQILSKIKRDTVRLYRWYRNRWWVV